MKPNKLLVTKNKFDYPNEIEDILKNISFNKKNIEVLGSMSIRSQWFASDYDCFEVVDKNSIQSIITSLKKIVSNINKKKNYFVGDIKIGVYEPFNVINENAYFENKNSKIKGYNQTVSLNKLKNLYEKNIISKNEFKYGSKLLVENPTPLQWSIIHKALRFDVLRWKYDDIMKEYLFYRGKKILLYNALNSNGLCKIDIIVRMNDNLFQEFSVIYDLRIRGKRLNTKIINARKSLTNDIILFGSQKKWFKTLKRAFSLYNYLYKYTDMNKNKIINVILFLNSILSSSLGIIYRTKSNMDSILYLLEYNKGNLDDIKNAIDEYIDDLNNVYGVSEFNKQNDFIVKELKFIQSLNDRDEMNNRLYKIHSLLENICNNATFERIKDNPIFKK